MSEDCILCTVDAYSKTEKERRAAYFVLGGACGSAPDGAPDLCADHLCLAVVGTAIVGEMTGHPDAAKQLREIVDNDMNEEKEALS